MTDVEKNGTGIVTPTIIVAFRQVDRTGDSARFAEGTITGDATGATSIGAKANRLTRKATPVDVPRPSSQARWALRHHWEQAKASSARMVLAAQSQDQMELAIAANDLEKALAKLWELRENRDVDWQTILNHAQGVTRQLFAEKRVESLSAQQSACIHELVERLLGTSTKSPDDLDEAVRLITDAGCDPYWAISGDSDDDQVVA
jgi:hypothetical protein